MVKGNVKLFNLYSSPGYKDHNAYWIGASDKTHEGDFHWSDGLPFSYTSKKCFLIFFLIYLFLFQPHRERVLEQCFQNTNCSRLFKILYVVHSLLMRIHIKFFKLFIVKTSEEQVINCKLQVKFK